MNEKQMWQAFITEQPAYKDENYQAWQYGAIPDELAQLTLSGIKTATSSAHCLYEIEKEELPKAGEWHIILDSSDQAVCIIRLVAVTVYPFKDVPAEIAYQEGEGDRTLAYWRAVHQRFFTDLLVDYDLSFSEEMLVVCEQFECVYPAKREVNR